MSATATPPSTSLDVVLSRLATRTGTEPAALRRVGGYQSDCPVGHADAADALHVREARDGRIVLSCQAGCASVTIAAALGLRVEELFPPTSSASPAIALVEEPDPLRRTRWRLDELLGNDTIMRPPAPIVPRIAWAGRSTLLAAREKAGKSTLTGYMTACVSNGARFLDEPCRLGVVLVIGLEEFIGDTARRLQKFHAAPTRVHLVDRFAGDPAMRPEELRAHVDAVSPTLVIVDSLTAYSHGQIQDDNNATQMAKVVQPLTDVVHQLGSSGLVIVHHVAKASGKSRGSTAITAAVDVVVEFEIPPDTEDTDPTLRRVRSVGRVPVPRLYDVRFDGDTYVLATGTETPLESRILAVVEDRPMISGTDITDVVGGRKTAVLNEIGRLLATGRLRNIASVSRPKYVLPGTPVSELHL